MQRLLRPPLLEHSSVRSVRGRASGIGSESGSASDVAAIVMMRRVAILAGEAIAVGRAALLATQGVALQRVLALHPARIMSLSLVLLAAGTQLLLLLQLQLLVRLVLLVGDEPRVRMLQRANGQNGLRATDVIVVPPNALTMTRRMAMMVMRMKTMVRCRQRPPLRLWRATATAMQMRLHTRMRLPPGEGGLAVLLQLLRRWMAMLEGTLAPQHRPRHEPARRRRCLRPRTLAAPAVAVAL